MCVRQSGRCSAVIVRKSPEGSSSTQYLPDKLTYLPFSGRCYMIFEKYFMIFHTYFMIFEKCPQVYFFTISVFIVWGPSSINRLVPSALFTILSDKILLLVKLTYYHFVEERKNISEEELDHWKHIDLYNFQGSSPIWLVDISYYLVPWTLTAAPQFKSSYSIRNTSSWSNRNTLSWFALLSLSLSPL